jgi:hypothetical protein
MLCRIYQGEQNEDIYSLRQTNGKIIFLIHHISFFFLVIPKIARSSIKKKRRDLRSKKDVVLNKQNMICRRTEQRRKKTDSTGAITHLLFLCRHNIYLVGYFAKYMTHYKI